jgi:peptide deformylase
MVETMKCADGIGIAAPQVGISLSLCIVTHLQKNMSNNNIIMINPKIIFKNNDKICSKEGCLSLPGIYEYVSRFNEIFCEYVNLDCKSCYIEAKGLLSSIIQHEVDHLNSILFIDYLPKYKKLNIDTRLKNNKSRL